MMNCISAFDVHGRYGAKIQEKLPDLQLRTIQASTLGNVFVDTASAQSTMPGLVERPIGEIGAEHVLFGTHTPLYFTATQRDRIDQADRGQTSYAEVPFGATAPAIAVEAWTQFVQRLLRPDFIVLTPGAEARRAALGVNRNEFITTAARPDELQIDSVDIRYAQWAAGRGVEDARIPQMGLDLEAFHKEKNFWRWQFPWLNFATVFDQILLHGHAVRNTFILVVLSIIGALTINPLAAYALSRFKMRATYHVLLFFLATMAFPAEVTMIPQFLQLREFGMLNSYSALIIPTLANGFSIFLLKGFFDSLPRELYEAAEIDGASELRMFWQFTMALSTPILAVIALGAFAGAYGAFFFALLLAPDPDMWTVMVYIYQLRQFVDQPVVFASLLITAVPASLVFIFCQNIILRGIIVPSEK